MTAVRPLLLAIDTATPSAAVALTSGTLGDGEVLAELRLAGGKTHSRRLLALVDVVLRESETSWEALDGIAIGLGPGSFTGLRIGMATAKGLAAAAGKPLYGVSTLDVLAAACIGERMVCSMIDARKQEVYAAFYRREHSGRVARQGEVLVVPPSRLHPLFTEPVVLVGSGARLYGADLCRGLGGRAEVAPATWHQPSAATLGMLAAELAGRGAVLDPIEGMPLYVRRSDAELNLAKKLRQGAGEGGR